MDGSTLAPPSAGRSLYAEVLDGILAQLESGAIPWIPPWNPNGALHPYNAVTKTRYSAFNVLLLWLTAQNSDFRSNGWLTANQISQLGGSPLPAARPAVALKWFRAYSMVPATSGAQGTASSVGGSAISKGPETKLVPRYSNLPAMTTFEVYNLDQVAGLPKRFYLPPPKPVDETAAPMKLVRTARVSLVHGGDSAYYSPSDDKVTMPHPDDFVSLSGYYATLLHEVVHWTGHPSRLRRNQVPRSNLEGYAAEELVAELGAAFLCAALGVAGELRHAGYLQSWLSAAKADNSYLFQAAMRAEQAVGYLERVAEGCIPGARNHNPRKQTKAGKRKPSPRRGKQ